jgi:hypothetical protein
MAENSKAVRGFRLERLANGNIQVYAKQRSRQLAAIGIKHSAWRLAFEISPAMIGDLYAFVNAPNDGGPTLEKTPKPANS